MTTSKPGTFKKGADPRRNGNGNLNSKAQAWSIRFRNQLALELGPEEAAKIMAREYRKGRPWAVAEVNERLMGKVTQPIDQAGNVTFRVIYEKPKDKVDASG